MEGGASNPGPLAPRSICPEVVCEKDHGSLDLSPGYDKGLAAASNATFDSVRMFVWLCMLQYTYVHISIHNNIYLYVYKYVAIITIIELFRVFCCK